MSQLWLCQENLFVVVRCWCFFQEQAVEHIQTENYCIYVNSACGVANHLWRAVLELADVIDLTHDRDEKDDLQRAIALSLRETAGRSRTIGMSADEEQDMSWSGRNSKVLAKRLSQDSNPGRPNCPWIKKQNTRMSKLLTPCRYIQTVWVYITVYHTYCISRGVW